MVDRGNELQNYQHLYKSKVMMMVYLNLVILVGDAGVGKTHLVHRYVNLLSLIFILYRYVKGKLPMNKPSTIGVEFATKNVELKNG